MKKRLMTSLAAGALMAAMLPGVASADKPTVYGPFTDTFTDFNPCTGEEMEVTLTFTFYDHEGHKNNFVGRAELTGSTSEGHVLIGGHDRVSAGPNGVSASFKDVWRNPDNGEKFQVSGKFRERGNAPVVEEFAMRCVGAPTILPE